ncbi:unnamed protein product [Boreogadus saida]
MSAVAALESEVGNPNATMFGCMIEFRSVHQVSERTVSQRVVCLGGVNSESSCRLQITTFDAQSADRKKKPPNTSGEPAKITECPVFDALRRPSSVATSSAASTSGSDHHPSTALSESLTAAVPPLCVPIFMRSSFIYAQRTCVLHYRRHYLSRTLTPTA